MSELSLYAIEASLQMLVDERERAEADGDSEAIKTIDVAFVEYLTREAAKIDSYAGLIHQLEADAAQVKAEADRLHARAKAMIARKDAIKAAALAAMQAHDVKELKTYRNTFRRCGNGGLQALEINQGALPEEFLKTVSVTAPNTDKIREALNQLVKCDKCDGGANFEYRFGCPKCGGKGVIPNTVPGARLLEQGEHVRVL